jgi:hypothetical protein
MTTKSYRAAMRPLMFTVVWFAFLAAAAFAWASIEDRQPHPPTQKHTIFVAR